MFIEGPFYGALPWCLLMFYDSYGCFTKRLEFNNLIDSYSVIHV